MNRRQKARYLLAIYLAVTFLAIILLLIAFNRGADTWQSLFLNLSTELLGVVLVFFLVNFLFLVGEWDLSERVGELVKRLESREHPRATDFFRQIPSLGPYIDRATQIDLCGVTLSSTLRKYLQNLHERLWAGCNIRLLVIDPDSQALEEADYRSDLATVTAYKKILASAFQDIEILLRKWENHTQDAEATMRGKLSVRLMPHVPPFGIQAFDVGRPNGTLFVEIYPHQTATKSPTFELTARDDGEWYKYFVAQFDKLWNTAEPWEPHAPIAQTAGAQ